MESNFTLSSDYRERINVLLDCSLATIGHGGGIPHDARVMVKLFSRIAKINPAILLHDPGNGVIHHRFVSKKTSPPLQRLTNQSLFLEALVSHKVPWSRNRLIRQIQRVKVLYDLLLRPRIEMDEMLEAFKDVIWRNAFAYSLDPKCREQILNLPVFLANLGNSMMFSRAFIGLPQPKLVTKGFDFVIFQDVRPVRVSRGTIKIIRYHDIIPIIKPDLIGSRDYIRWHSNGLRICARDSVFVCNSEPTKSDLLNYIPEIEERCFVIPYPVAKSFYPDPQPGFFISEIIKRRWSSATGIKWQPKRANMKAPYILHVGTLEPRKNLVGLIKAFSLLRKKYNEPLHLIVVGNLGWSFEPILKSMVPLVRSGELIHLEKLTSEELRVLYSNASVFCFPSYYEGFGIPPLEALACGTPAVVSDIPPHRWVLKDAAIYCDPYDPESIAEALHSVLSSPDSVKNSLVKKGLSRAKEFSEENMANRWYHLLSKLKEEGGI